MSDASPTWFSVLIIVFPAQTFPALALLWATTYWLRVQ